MLPTDAKLWSADDHIIEHPTVWQDRLPAIFRDTGPRIVEVDDGTQAWAYEDLRIPLGRQSTRGLPGVDMSEDAPYAIRFDEIRPGCYEPQSRLEDMDEDGVWAQLCFPNFARFGGHRFLEGKDRALSLLCVQAYNDFVVDEWSAVDRERLIPLGIVPLWDPVLAAREVERIADKGMRAIAFSENPTILGLPSVYTRHWDPLWEAVSDVDLPVCIHIGSSSKHFTTSEDQDFSAVMTLVGLNSMAACADWMFSGILDRFPRLKVILSEGGAGWAPYIIERADRVFTHTPAHKRSTERLPSETFAEHIHVCMVTETFALHSLDWMPVDNVLWESDYPHADSLWPHSRKLFEAALVDTPEDIALKLAGDNLRRLLKIN